MNWFRLLNVYKITLISFFFFLYPASASFSSDNLYGGRLISSVNSDPRSFNPVLAKETSTTAITGIIFEGLTRTDGVSLKVEPNLAKGWQVDESGLVWIFFLRDDVRWHDGKKFDADDVIFTFNQLIYNPKIPNSARDILTIEGEILKVEKIDRFRVKITLPRRFAPFLRSMSQEILPKHLLEAAVKADKFNFTWGIDTDPEKIIGTGPFKLSKYLAGQELQLIRNPHYWKKDKNDNLLPYLDKIIFLIVPNQETALLKFQEGEIDYYSLRGIDYPILKPKERKNNFTIYEMGPGFGSSFLTFNLNSSINPKTNNLYIDSKKHRWFNNIEFRKAIAHCIDKQKIIDIVLQGFGYPQNGSMSPNSGMFYNPNVETYPYDLKKAEQILRGIGFIDRDDDGIVEDRSDEQIEFNLFTVADSNERIQIAAIIRKDLASVGIKANLVPLEFNILVRKLVATFDWDAVVIGLTGGVEPHFGKNVWHSSGQLHMWNPKQETPATDWEKRIDQIFDSAVQELDEDKRKVLYDEWQLIVSQNLPLIYAVLDDVVFAVKNKFGNLKPMPLGGAFHNLEEIYIKTDYLF